MKLPDWLVRALKTFVQAAVGFLVADAAVIGEALTDWNTGKHVLLSVVIGAIAAGVSAAWNIVLERLNSKQA